jgi:Ketopantoate reductase PanE/ApbA
VVASEVTPVYDAVFLTCKAYDLDAAVAAIAPAVAPTGYVLPFLNGIAHIDVLNERFGRHRVLGGTAKIQATITSNGDPAVQRLADAHLWRAIRRDDRARKNIGGAVRGCEGRGSLRGHRHRSANVGKAGSPLDRGRHDLPDASKCRRDCPHPMAASFFSISFAVVPRLLPPTVTHRARPS